MLTHTHTSSGRIPTDEGYRYYVDKLSDSEKMEGKLDEDTFKNLIQTTSNIDDLMQATAILLSKVSRLFGFVMISEVNKSILTDIELISLSSDRVMVVLAMKTGLIRSIVLELKVVVNQNELDSITAILKECLLGLSLDEIQKTIHFRVCGSDVFDHEIIQVLINEPASHFSLAGNTLIYTSSFSELLNYPEFQEVTILQKTIKALDKRNIKQFIKSNVGSKKKYTFIGHETNNDLMDHFSILTSRFSSDLVTGQLAVLGPTRLRYQFVKRILEDFSKVLPNVC
jgi:heat-inducible transcriptional repressor